MAVQAIHVNIELAAQRQWLTGQLGDRSYHRHRVVDNGTNLHCDRISPDSGRTSATLPAERPGSLVVERPRSSFAVALISPARDFWASRTRVFEPWRTQAVTSRIQRLTEPAVPYISPSYLPAQTVTSVCPSRRMYAADRCSQRRQ